MDVQVNQPGTNHLTGDLHDFRIGRGRSSGGGTDRKGHWLEFTYGLKKNWTIGAQYFINEVDLASGNNSDYDRLMIDMQWKWK